jgi:hypothetical protein
LVFVGLMLFFFVLGSLASSSSSAAKMSAMIAGRATGKELMDMRGGEPEVQIQLYMWRWRWRRRCGFRRGVMNGSSALVVAV